MTKSKLTRRSFIRQGLVGGTVAGAASLGLNASSIARVIGANERINLGLIGGGHRGRFIVEQMAKGSGDHYALVAFGDIWTQRRESYPPEAEKILGIKPKAYADYRQLLEDADVDAVVIATPDHQHAGQTIDAVRAGKHVYVEKPIIGLHIDLPELNRLYDVVKASKMVVQHGTHGASSPVVRAIRQLIAEGKLGKLFRVESAETAYVPYWAHYQGPATVSETDWKAWLYNRPQRPFDANMCAKWMGYKEITSGTIGGWMTHFITFVHAVTGCDYPVSAVAWGGRYAPTNDPKCTAPDQTMVMLDYAEGFHTQFTSHFGSEIDNETTVFMFEKGCVKTRFGHNPGNPLVSGEGTNSRLEAYKLLGDAADPPYPGAEHVKNWFDCIRKGGRPNADMDLGHKQGVAVALGDLAWDLNCKVVYDKAEREVRRA
jgi:predicted dehydrogenase